MLRGILTVGGWTLASRILGFARDILTAALLGAGPVADAFFVANRLPALFRRLFGEGAFNAAFVPGFSGLLAAEGEGAAREFAEQTTAIMVFWLLGITVAGEIFMPQVMTVFAPGFISDPPKFALAVTLSRITFPYMPLICLTALLSGVLNGLDRFAAAAAAPVLANIILIGCLVGLLHFHLVPTAGHALAWGVSISGIFQLALLVWAVRHAGMRLRVKRPRLTPQMRTLFKRMAPGLLGAGVTQLNQFVDLIIATLLPAGTVSVLYYANQLNQLPLAIIGTAVGTALLPSLSRQALAGEGATAVATMNRALEYALTLTLPAALALLAVPRPIVAVLFERGAFGQHSAILAAQSLAAYAVGLPAFVLVKVLVPGFFARGDTAMPMKIGIAAVALNLVLNLLFMVPLQNMGPPLASSLAGWFNVGLLVLVLTRRGHMAVDAQLRRVVARMLAAGLVMVAVLLVLERTAFAAMAGHGALRWVGLALLVAGGAVAYGAAGQLLGAFDLRKVAGRSRRAADSPGS
jgi:putative peptidoglycan lipid II flippase